MPFIYILVLAAIASMVLQHFIFGLSYFLFVLN